MRPQRLLSCLLLLQSKHRQTARQLAGALEVSIRTVYRDVEALSAAGVPVYMERGPRGGVVLSDEYRRAFAQFTHEELQALFAASTEPLADLGIVSHTHALQKLAGALSDAQRRAAEGSRQRLLLDHNRWYRNRQPTAVLATLREAVAQERRLRLRYRDRGGAITDRLTEPLGLVAKAGIWYLVARDVGKGYRTFRAERIVGLEDTGQRFTRPADFELDAYWRSSTERMEQRPVETYEVVLRVRADALEHITPYWEVGILDEEPGFATLHVRFPSRALAVVTVLALDDAVEVVEPQELPAALLECARGVLARYDGEQARAGPSAAAAS